MTLFTVIAYYITSISKQLKFLKSHCSIVCSYCSVVSLIAKNGLKNDRIFKFFEIKRNLHGFRRGYQKYNFFQGGPNFEGGTAGKFREMGNNREPIVMQIGWWSISKENISSYPPGTKILVMSQFSYMPDQILGKK